MSIIVAKVLLLLFWIPACFERFRIKFITVQNEWASDTHQQW